MTYFFRPTLLQSHKRRGAKSFRAASCHFAHLSFTFLPMLSCAVLIAGCTSSAPNPSSDSARSTPGWRANGSASSVAPKSGSSALTQWWNALTKSAGQVGKTGSKSSGAATAPTGIPIVVVDVAAIAARHPAWKLADALEKNSQPAPTFQSIPGSAPSQMQIVAPSFDVRFNNPAGSGPNSNSVSPNSTSSNGVSGNQTEQPSATPDEFFNSPESQSSPIVAAADLAETEAAIGDEQRESVAIFLAMVTQRQTDWRSDYASILKTALDEEVAAMQRTPVPTLALPLPSRDAQLEMTNLQLQLSRNIFLTEEARKAVQARLDYLFEQWRSELRLQAQLRAKELQRLRIKEPQQARAAGLQRIEAELSAIESQQREIRIATLNEHRARVKQDFGDEQARLGIVLPPSGVLPGEENAPDWTSPNFPTREISALPGASSGNGLTSDSQLVFTRTNSSAASSVRAESGAPLLPPRVADSSKAAQVRALRTLAWRESIKQIQMVSRRSGWQWRSRAQSQLSKQKSGAVFPDRTRETLQALYGASAS